MLSSVRQVEILTYIITKKLAEIRKRIEKPYLPMKKHIFYGLILLWIACKSLQIVNLLTLEKLKVIVLVISSVAGLLTITRSVNLAIMLWLNRMFLVNVVVLYTAKEVHWKMVLLVGMELLAQDQKTKEFLSFPAKFVMAFLMITKNEYSPLLGCLIAEIAFNYLSISGKELLSDVVSVTCYLIRRYVLGMITKFCNASVVEKIQSLLKVLDNVQRFLIAWRQPSNLDTDKLKRFVVEVFSRFKDLLLDTSKRYGDRINSDTIVQWYNCVCVITLGFLLYASCNNETILWYHVGVLIVFYFVGTVQVDMIKVYVRNYMNSKTVKETNSQSWLSSILSAVKMTTTIGVKIIQKQLLGHETKSDKFCFGSLSSLIVFWKNSPRLERNVEFMRDIYECLHHD